MKTFRLSKLVGFLVGGLFYLAPTSGNAQTNIAPLATVTASTCNTGPCSTLNDLNLGTCGTQQMWISTATPPSLVPGVNYIEWVFPTVRSFDSLIIHHAQNNARFLTGATVQFWDGAAWVTHSSFANLPQNCINRVGIGKLSTDRFRITSFIPGTGQQSNMNFREIEVLEAPSGLHDAAVLSLDSPRVYCAGTQNVVATIANFGINQIDSVDVNWSVNGVAQPVVKYIGLLDTLLGTGSTTAQIVLGNAAFAAGATNIQVYTSNPNGALDTLNFNDTVNVAVQSAAAPTSITTSNATLNSIDVNAVGGAGTVDYEYGPLGFAVGTGTSGSSATPNFTISGLTQGATYDVYVRSNCGSGDISAFVGPQTFNTSYGIPFVQDYENFAAGIVQNPYPEGWSTNNPGNGQPRWESEVSTGANTNSGATGPFWDNTNYLSTGGMYMYMETSGGTVGDSVDFISPPIFVDTSLNTVEVSYAYFMFGTNIDRLQVIADTNGVETVLATYTGAQQAAQGDPWLIGSHFLNGYNGKSVTIKFRGWNVACCSGDIAVDDLRIDPVLPLNTGVIEVQNPTGNLCAGPANVVVGVKNFGSNVIDSVNVVWDVNGILDSTMFVGTILPGDTASVPLATLSISSTVVYDLEFYTNRPNNAADQFNVDDTLKVQGLRTGLDGVYTLDAALPASSTNLVSFSQLGQVLSDYGVCGPTTVNVAAGTYNDVLTLDNVAGLSATNTLTIDGGDSATTAIESNLAVDNAVISLSSVSYTTIKNLTVRSLRTNTALHFGVHLGGGSNFDSLVNVRVTVNPTATFNVFGVAATLNTTTNFGNGDHANNFVMMNSSVDGGDWNVMFRGNGGNFPGPASTNGWNMNNQFIGNTLTNADDYGLYTDDQDGLLISGNTISDLRTTSTFTGYGIAAFDGMNFTITGNNVISPYTGIYVTNANSSSNGTRVGFSEVSNNMVSCDRNSGIWLQRPVAVNIWANSVYCGTTSNFEAALYLDDGFGTPAMDSIDVRNNALSSLGKALLLDEPDSVFLKFDNNSFFTASADLLDIDGVLYATLAPYQLAQPGYNASSLDGDPQFISTTDLHVTGSFINDGGDNSVPITVDIDGDTRPIAGSTTVDIGADEFDPPACPPSVNLGATNITLTTADIFWTGVTMDYEYEVVLAGAGQGTGTVVSTILDSVAITGLTPSTSYDFYTREICGRGDTSIWIGPFTFGTSNGVPFFEDFETFAVPTTGNPWPKGWTSNTTFNPRWESETGNGVNINSFNTGPFYDNTTFGVNGGTYIYMETSGGAGNLADFRSPGIFVDPTQASLTLEVAIHMFGATMGTLEVLVDSNGVENSLFTVTGQQQTAQGDAYIIRTANIGGYQGKSINLIFRGLSGSSFTSDIAIDDVRIFEPSPQDGAVTDIISPTSGCGLGVDSVTVEISNLGTATLDSIPVVYVLNGGTPVVETYFDSITPGLSANFTFSVPANLTATGSYSLVAYTDLLVDGDVTNDTTTVSINNIPLVSSFPYSEDFELGNGGWAASGANSTWAWGTPAGAVISSAAGGTGAWVTNLTGNHNNNESSFIESPCLDLSSLTVDPILTFSLTYDTESCCDEGWIDVSTDGGLTWSRLNDNGGAQNWYNDLFNQWWDGTSSGGAGVWVTAENILTGLAGQSSVKIRIGFSSDGSVVREGFGIDDVNIDLPQAFNMALVDIVTPVSGAYTPGLTDSIRVTLANIGSDTATNFTVNYVLNGGPVVTETIASVLPGDTLLYVFNSSIALPAAGQADTLDVYVDFTADTDNSNDSILGYIFDNDIKGVPYVEDFENSYVLGNVLTNQQGGWTSTRTNSPDWEIEDASGANENSTGTGPWYDRTTFGTAGGFYAYLECSGGSLGDQDTMRSPSILVPVNATAMALDYAYHMYGTDMGTLELFIEANGVYTRLDSVGGQIQLAGDSSWSDTSIALTGAFNGQIINIVFVGTRGNGFTSDMSIDNINLDFLVGVNENVASTLEGISISPNPSNGLFKLSIETPAQENFNMTVRDAQGRSVYTANFDVNGTYRNDLDFTSFAKGVYYMQIQTETGSTVEKLIIQ